MLKLATDKQTNQQTDRQTNRQNKNNMPPIIRSGVTTNNDPRRIMTGDHYST